MSDSSSTRLERALELFVSHQQNGGDWQSLLREHPDLAELLQSFQDDGAGAAPLAASATTAATAAGRLGDFELVREVGQGGVGTVHEARQRSLGRRVALKLLHAEFAQSPTALLRFRREAQSLARLDHRGIVRVLAVGEQAGRHWLAMEFVEGESLAARLDAMRRGGGHAGQSRREMVEIVAAVAEALQHAHDAGIVHRDVKPSNILLRADGTPVLSDFGLARETADASLTQTGVLAGTPHYMAPEHIAGTAADCDVRTDVFALGATLYECLTLQHAFEGENAQQVLQAILTRDPIDPRRRHRGLPVELAAITLKALEKDPARRYPTARTFAEDLRAFLELRPVTARPPTRTQRLLRLCRRRPLVGALAVLAAATVVLGGILLAQLPDVRAAAAVQREREYEDAMLAGMTKRVGSDAAACYEQFERALRLEPDSAEALAALALCIHHFDGPERALAELDRRAGAAAGTGDVGHCRALLLRRLQRLEEATALEASLGPPATPMSLLLAAVAQLDERSDKAAVQRSNRLMTRAIHIAPHPRLLMYAQWAVLQTVLEDRGLRVEAAETLLLLWPQHPYAMAIAAANLIGSDNERAERLLRRALELGVEEPLARLNHAITLHLLGRVEEAEAEYRLAFTTSQLTDSQRAKLIDLVHQLGAEATERELADRWLQEAPDGVAALRSTARIALRSGDIARSLQLLRQAVAKSPQDHDARADLAFALMEDGDVAAALPVLQPLAGERPGDAWVHDLLLDACDQIGDAAAALAERQRWAEANAKDPAAWIALAEALLRSRGADATKRALLAAERADHAAGGKDPQVLRLRATAHEALGDTAAAARLRERAAAAAPGIAVPPKTAVR